MFPLLLLLIHISLTLSLIAMLFVLHHIHIYINIFFKAASKKIYPSYVGIPRGSIIGYMLSSNSFLVFLSLRLISTRVRDKHNTQNVQLKEYFPCIVHRGKRSEVIPNLFEHNNNNKKTE
jgi:hypothetical protein